MEKQVCVCVHTYTYRNKCYCIFETIIIWVKCIILDFNSGVFVSVRIEMIIPWWKKICQRSCCVGIRPRTRKSRCSSTKCKNQLNALVSSAFRALLQIRAMRKKLSPLSPSSFNPVITSQTSDSEEHSVRGSRPKHAEFMPWMYNKNWTPHCQYASAGISFFQLPLEFLQPKIPCGPKSIFLSRCNTKKRQWDGFDLKHSSL